MTQRCNGSGQRSMRADEWMPVDCVGCSTCLKGPALDERVGRIVGLHIGRDETGLLVWVPKGRTLRLHERWYGVCPEPGHQSCGNNGIAYKWNPTSDPLACDEAKRWLRERGIILLVRHFHDGVVAEPSSHQAGHGNHFQIGALTEPEAVARFIVRLDEDGLLKEAGR